MENKGVDMEAPGSSQLCLCVVMTAARGEAGLRQLWTPSQGGYPRQVWGTAGTALPGAPLGNQGLLFAQGNRPGGQAPLLSEELLAASRRHSSPVPCPGLLRSEYCKVRPQMATASPSCRLVSINCISGQVFSLTRAETEDCSYLPRI